MLRFALQLSLSLLVGSLSVFGTAAAEGKAGTLSFTVENDVIGGTDRHYTNGLRVAYVSGAQEPTAFERLIAGDRADTATFRRSFSLGQSIYTPESYHLETPAQGQHPYGGNLFGEYAFMTEDQGRWDLFTMEVGVVGDWSLAEETQNWFHRSLGFQEAEGWDHQIDNEVTVNVAYDWKGRALAEGKVGHINWEVTPAAGVSLGTVATNLRGGAMLRIGDNLEPNFGPARIRPSLTGAGHFKAANPLDWYAFIGVQGRAVAHDIFLDGSLLRDDSPSIEKNTYVADLQAGVALTHGGLQLSWTYVHRTERFEGQNGADGFGAFTLSTKF